jgi:hypothetical protein
MKMPIPTHNVPIPKNLPLLLNSKNPAALAVIDKILRENQTDVEQNLAALGQFWKIRVWFDQPVKINLQPRWHDNGNGSKTLISAKTTDNYVFSYFWTDVTHGLIYRTGKSGRASRGFPFDQWLHRVIKYEPVLEPDKETSDEFKTFDEFKRRFDPQFISEAKIQELWNNPSSQTGQRYRRSDFRRIGREGQQVMGRFLHFFKGIGTGDNAPGYFKSRFTNQDGSEYYSFEEHYTSNGRQSSHFGRDIKISHQTNQQIVHYSSEYPGCGNGRYGLVVNKTTFLHLEDD